MSPQPASPESTIAPKPTDRLVGESSVMLELKRLARSISSEQFSLLIHGEVGTGKESLGRYIHANSDRAEKPFVPVDCSSLSDLLFEAELFGTVKGTFEGSQRDSLGFIRAADGGSIYLDEICQLTLPLQARLLHVLQTQTVVPVGATVACPVNVRVMAATSCDLQEMVNQGKFLAELHTLLKAVTLQTPRLHDRTRDVLPLAEHFLNVQAELYREPLKKLSMAVEAVFEAYAWPGNVRELVNVLEQSHVLASGETITLGDIPLRMQNAPPQPDQQIDSLSLDELERHTIVTALKRCNYNRARAARMLGINIQKLKRRMTRFGLRAAPAASTSIR
jgi:DNA-binding NtrC family response regulator